MTWLWILALVAQTADAAATCRAAHRHPTLYAQPPRLVCASTIASKVPMISSLFLLRGRPRAIWAGVLIGTGSVGVVLTLSLGKDA